MELKAQYLQQTQMVFNLQNGTEKEPQENLLRLLSKLMVQSLTDGWLNTSKKHGTDMTLTKLVTLMDPWFQLISEALLETSKLNSILNPRIT
jgi:hypothetical protein